jgi:hypothetical protein
MNIDQRVQNSIYRTGSLCRTRLCLTCARSLTATTMLRHSLTNPFLGVVYEAPSLSPGKSYHGRAQACVLSSLFLRHFCRHPASGTDNSPTSSENEHTTHTTSRTAQGPQRRADGAVCANDAGNRNVLYKAPTAFRNRVRYNERREHVVKPFELAVMIILSFLRAGAGDKLMGKWSINRR